jgi:putative ABC transport system substrate-binding protein
MRRRGLLGMTVSAAAMWAAMAMSAAKAQPLPRIAYVSGRSLATDGHLLQAFRDGLKQTGFVDGQNVTIDVRWADGKYDQVPAMMAEIVARKPDVIAAVGGNPVGVAAKQATSTIPVIFSAGADPVKIGLVGNLNRPEANLTGITLWANELDVKRLDLLRELLPSARRVALMVNSTNPGEAESLESMREGAATLGLALDVLNAPSSGEIERAFASLTLDKVDALAVAADAFLINRRDRIVALVAERRLPSIFPAREFAEAGGLMSYGTRWSDMYRIVGTYAGRVLKGAKVGDLPVQRPTTYELVLNMKTARTLGLTVSPTLLARADDVLE